MFKIRNLNVTLKEADMFSKEIPHRFASLEERIEKLEEIVEEQQKIITQRNVNIDTSQWADCEPWELGGC